MALKLKLKENIRLVGDVELNSYVRVTSVFGSKHRAEAEVAFCKDEANGEQIKVVSYQFVPDMSGKNFIAQAYAHLKSLPEFSDAVDC